MPPLLSIKPSPSAEFSRLDVFVATRPSVSSRHTSDDGHGGWVGEWADRSHVLLGLQPWVKNLPDGIDEGHSCRTLWRLPSFDIGLLRATPAGRVIAIKHLP